jgi:YD repeat-containing protein
MALMLPLVRVAGMNLHPPDFWPMGLGTGKPSEMIQGHNRFSFTWDDRQRLTGVEIAWSPDGWGRRVSYHWRPDGTIERIAFDQREDQEEPDYSGPREVHHWTFEGGRPRKVVEEWPVIEETGNVRTWDWSADGRTARITETSEHGVLEVREVEFDARGKLLGARTDRGGTGGVDVVLEVSYSPDGRLIGARETEGNTVREVVYHWDARGRLVRQTSTASAFTGEWTYHYPDDAGS